MIVLYKKNKSKSSVASMNANIEMKLLLESFHIPAYLHGVICY